MDYSNISGMDLFGMPFSRRTQAAKPSQEPKQQESRPQSAVQKPSAAQPQKTAALAKQAESAKTAGALYKPSPEPPGCKKENPVLQEEGQEKQKDKAPEPKIDKDPVPELQPDAESVSPKSPVSAQQTQPEPPKKELVLDMSDGTAAAGIPLTACDEEKRRAHEAAEEKRKAEWEANQKAKKKKEEAEIQKLQNMSDEEAVAASTERIRTDVERITRRNMKEAVSEHVQKLCCSDSAFARKTMHPRKSMVWCFKYISRQARDYVKQEMEENGIKPDNGGYGCDVPDGIVYQWAEDYFNDPDAPEDYEKESAFVPRPYAGAAAKAKKPASKPKKPAKPAKKETQETAGNDYEQMTLGV